MPLDCQRHRPSALASPMEPHPLRVDTWPPREEGKRGPSVVRIDRESVRGRKLAGITPGGRASPSLVVGENGKSQARVNADPDVVEVAFTRLRAVNDHD